MLAERNGEAAAALGADVTVAPYGPGDGLPLFVTPRTGALRQDRDAATGWMREHEAALDGILRDVGAVVLRGFAFGDTGGFAQAIDHYPDMAFGYAAGAAPRANIQGRVFEATRSPPEVSITLHQEMAYLPAFPSRLAFFCNHAPDSGGETLIGDVRRFEALVSQRFRGEVEARGVRYVRSFRSPDFAVEEPRLEGLYKTWAEAFSTDDPVKVEAECAAMGLECVWNADGGVSVRYDSPGFVRHPVTGRQLWFNQIATQTMTDATYGPEVMGAFRRLSGAEHPLPYVTTFADGGPIAEADVAAVRQTLAGLQVAFPWRQGDLMLIDNFLTFHGRSPYAGRRDVQVALLN
ncbi:MAG: TauD/TfdA family dioxygenase [Caulobacteraceae bacterium]|nr:TauD/TfdA family dioxygenase [Caulobacteraceae bacterium]